MSAPKRRVESSVNQKIMAGLSAVKEFLAGGSADANVAAPEDQETREVVAAELLAAMSRRGANKTSENSEEKLGDDSKNSLAAPVASEQGTNSDNNRHTTQSELHSDQSAEMSPEVAAEQERARQLFLDHGYFDETVQRLKTASSAEERAAAARALGLVGNQRATAHLIAAMFDEDPEVRNAAEGALAQIGEATSQSPAVAPVAVDESTNRDEASATTETSPEGNWLAPLIEPAEARNIESVDVDMEAVAEAQAAVVEIENETVVAPQPAIDLGDTNSAESNEADELLREEQAIRESLSEIEQRVQATVAAFLESENEIRLRIEHEAKLQAEATARRREEDEQRKRAEAEAEEIRVQQQEAIIAERAARAESEAEAQRYAQEETNLRLNAASLRLDIADTARRRADMETARQEAAEAARQEEARNARNESRSRHEAELERLRVEEEASRRATDEVLVQQTNVNAAREKAANELLRLKEEQAKVEADQRAEAEQLRRAVSNKKDEGQEQLRAEVERLRLAGEEVAKHRAEVEAAREQADAEAQQLGEAQVRMKAAEEARAEAEQERLQLEVEINQQIETQLRLLEETRRRGQEEQERLQEELRLRAEKEEQRLSELELMKNRAELESKQRVEQQQQILALIDSLRIADAENRKRIEEAEVKRRAADDACRLIAEKVQRVEAEAHASAKEEERMLAKLESTRRNAAIEAQSRAEQEKRIREEIEMFRRLEEEERPKLESAALQLTEAETRLQERKERYRENGAAPALVEEELVRVGTKHPVVTEPDPTEVTINEEPAMVSPSEAATPAAASEEVATSGKPEEAINGDEAEGGDAVAASAVTPAIASYLSSVDPYKRAAAVAELARSGSANAFSRIVACFDDHSPHVRNAAARALRKLEPERTVDIFNRALEEASPTRRRNIGAAIAASGLAKEAIENLDGESREETYNALSFLFVMAKTGEVGPLVRALEEHGEDEIGKAVSKLLTLSGHQAGEQPAGDSSSN